MSLTKRTLQTSTRIPHLLAHLSLLFIPVGVGVMTHLALLAQYGGRMLVVIALSTWIGLGVSAAVMWWPRPASDGKNKD